MVSGLIKGVNIGPYILFQELEFKHCLVQNL